MQRLTAIVFLLCSYSPAVVSDDQIEVRRSRQTGFLFAPVRRGSDKLLALVDTGTGLGFIEEEYFETILDSDRPALHVESIVSGDGKVSFLSAGTLPMALADSELKPVPFGLMDMASLSKSIQVDLQAVVGISLFQNGPVQIHEGITVFYIQKHQVPPDAMAIHIKSKYDILASELSRSYLS